MSNRHGSISDYPEHLNPFYEGNEKLRFWKFGKVKKSNSFGETLRNTLTLKSFRGKKRDKKEIPPSPPELRKPVPTAAPRQRQTLPTNLSPIYSPRNTAGPALPRSRFSERVRKTSANLEEEEVPNGHVPLTAPKLPAAANPFDEDEKLAELKPKRIRRRKKRAPLPPNMAREEGDAYLGVSSMHNFSKWSLTSVETDVSAYSESDHLSLDAVNQEMSDIMNNITKEMEKMTDDTNTNNTSETKETFDEKTHSGVNDLTAASPEDIKGDEIRQSTENASIYEDSKHENKDQPTDENSNVVPKVIGENVEGEIKDVNNFNENETTPEGAQKNNCDVIEDSSSIKSEAKSGKKCDAAENTPSAEEVQKNSSDGNEDTPSVKVEMKSVEICDENENTATAETELENSNCDAKKYTPSAEEELIENANNCDESENAASKSECDTISNCSEKSHPDILYNATYNHAASVQDLNFNERKSIFITASNDQLDKTDTIIENTIEVTENVDINQNKNVSPPTSPRCKTQVSVTLSNHAQEGVEEQEVENVYDKKEEAVYHPIPKTRANKPSKSDLLGNEITGTG